MGPDVRKWFRHNLAGASTSPGLQNTLTRTTRSRQGSKLLAHLINQCTADRGSCGGCPPEPEGPGSSPTLEGYKTGDIKACSISEVLQHPYVGRLSTNIVIQGPLGPSFLVVPEQLSLITTMARTSV
ncbi:hypothetical protein VC83_03595 [Pseudogymnoascus destructans]|uniref:Uncharacterized protein n=1 Tax=Pseudogymnoascus destructans TaxID=655981 RepID=A0A177AGR3_9PEZI|nr:uncharacterized protein VC83_03595 [Pseudogymnoascus destructans]OAF60451.1 hypothetical protein VC83_03595 [Pseudogymnoascus destructans]